MAFYSSFFYQSLIAEYCYQILNVFIEYQILNVNHSVSVWMGISPPRVDSFLYG